MADAHDDVLAEHMASLVADLEILVGPDEGTALPKPFYVNCVRTTYITPDPLNTLLTKLVDTFHTFSVDFSKSHEVFGYQCTAVALGAFIEFVIAIFAYNGGHMVEVRRVAGCRFAFGSLSDSFAHFLQITYEGGGHTIPPTPPPLPKTFPLVEIPDWAVRQACTRILDDISPEASRSSILGGLRAVGSTAFDAHQKNLFRAGGYAVPLAVHSVGVFTATPDDLEVQITAIAAIACVAEIDDVDESFVRLLEPIFTAAARHPNLHVRREAFRTIGGNGLKGRTILRSLVETHVMFAIHKACFAPDKATAAYAQNAFSACYDAYMSTYMSTPCHSGLSVCAHDV
jgi:hypothetical protein